MAAAVPMMEAGPPSNRAASPRASSGISTRPALAVKPMGNSAHASPGLMFRQLTPPQATSMAAMADNSVAASLTLHPRATGSATSPGHADSSATGWVELQRRIEESMDSKITKVLEDIRTFVSQSIETFMERLRSEKLSRERSLLDVQRQLDDLAQRMGPGALVPFEDLARMTSAAASQLEASVDHAQRCCESAREAVQREVGVFRHDIEDHRAKHFAEIAALRANNLQTSNSEQQLKKSPYEVGLVEMRREFDERCNAMGDGLQLLAEQVQLFQKKMDLGDVSSVAKSDGNSLEEIKQGVTQAMAEFGSQHIGREEILEIRALMEKREKAMKQDIEALRGQQTASSAGLKEQLGNHLERTVETAQAALMRSFFEEHKTLIGSLLEERESRTQEVLYLNERIDRIVNDRNGVTADNNQPCENGVLPQSEHGNDQDSKSLNAQMAELRNDMSSLRDRNDQLNSLLVGDAAVASKLVDELRESKRSWNVDTVRLQERLADSLQSIGAVQTQCKELQEWRENVDSKLSTSGQAAKLSEEKASATTASSGVLDVEHMPKRLLQEMSTLRGEVKTSLESAVTAVRLGEQLVGELQAERQARRKDMNLIHGLLGKAVTPRVSPPSEGVDSSETNVSNSALGFQARLLSRGWAHTAPNDSRERLSGPWTEASLPTHANVEVNNDVHLDELEIQRRLHDRAAGGSTVTEPASGSTSVPPAGSAAVPSPSGRTSAVSPLWPTRDVPRVPMLDLSATASSPTTREGEPIWAPDQEVTQGDNVIASRRTLPGSALWSSQSCHNVGSASLAHGTSGAGNAQPTSGGAFTVPMTVDRMIPAPLASPGADRSMSSQRPRPAASPSTGGLRNIQPQLSGGLGLALSGGPIRQQTVPAQRLSSSSSLAAAPTPGSVSVSIAHSGSPVLQAGFLQVRGPSPRLDSSPLDHPPSSPLRSRQPKTSIPGRGSPDRANAVSPLRQVSNMAMQGSSLSVAVGGSGPLRTSSPRMVQVARSVSPLRMSRRSVVHQ